MKIKLIQYVNIESDIAPYFWEKTYESSIMPIIGNKIQDSLWKDPYEYKIEDVVIDYKENECTVTMEKYSHEIPKERVEEISKLAQLHGWTTYLK